MTDRVILDISGADRLSFLQGLITNDVDKSGEGQLSYGALLTPQGKLISDFLYWKEGDSVYLDVAAAQADMLEARLAMYRLRADVTIARTLLLVRRGTGPMPEGAMADPRSPALGWRAYGTEAGDDGTDWDRVRVAELIPEGGRDIGPETYILEAGFERLGGVDFKKGCYVGQEVTARMKHKTSLRKGLVRVVVDGPAAEGTPITADGKPIGEIKTRAGDAAIAYLRLDRADRPMTAGDAKVALSAGPRLC